MTGAMMVIVASLVITVHANAERSTFERTHCPTALAKNTACHAVRDSSGAWLLAVIPAHWNRQLIVHAHGGPRLSEPALDDSREDVQRFASMVAAGYAWIGTTYRRGGYGVRMAAADADRSRELFWAQWGRPQRTLLHGQSWGGNVAAKAAELYALDADGRANYDAVLTTNGLLFGGTHAYGFRADLRVIYQHYCRNHPRPDELQYPLWQGLPADGKMTRDELSSRLNECAGLNVAEQDRSAEQRARLKNIVAVSGIAEANLLGHLAWATFHFQDLIHRRLGGGNPFDNAQTFYRGSHDDAALNANIQRFAADPQVMAKLAYDADMSGLIVVPMLTVHALHDPVVSFDAEAAYAATIKSAGRRHLLAQFATDESNHSRLADETYLTALTLLATWLDTGVKPKVGSAQPVCIASTHNATACRFTLP